MGFWSSLSALIGVRDRITTEIEFWKEFRGERIAIIKSSIKRTKNSDNEAENKVRITNYVIEGEIDDVMSFPPGFRLDSVKEYWEISDYSLMQPLGELSGMAYPDFDDSHNVKEIDTKFVSFDSIEEIERIEHRKEMSKPILEGFDSPDEENE